MSTSLSGKAPSPVKAARTKRVPKLNAPETTAPDETRAKALPLIMSVLEDAKAENVSAIDLLGKTSIADYMIVASGRSDRHVGAIAEQILSRLKDEGFGNAKVEGMPLCEWVLLDAGDIIVHIFKPEVRNFYNLEKMWSGDRPDEKLREAR